MRINLTREFAKQYRKTDHKIRKAVDKRLELFLKNPLNPILNNHSLSGNFQGYRSINITGDWRAIYSEIKEGDQTLIVFKSLGTHSQLYR